MFFSLISRVSETLQRIHFSLAGATAENVVLIYTFENEIIISSIHLT